MKAIFKNLNPNPFILVFAVIIIGALVHFGSCSKTSSPGANQVFMQGTSFSPATITVSAGTTITWFNKGGVNHTVTSDTTGLFNSGDVVPGSSYSFKFTNPGTYPYKCIYHVSMGMVGTVIVK
jgi:plastocyanin